MEYVYSAMLLHSAKKEITEGSVKKVLEAAGMTPDEGKVKSMVASLKEVNIDDAIQKAAVSMTASAAPAAHAGAHEAKAEKKPEEEKKTEEEAAAGLGSLFG